jgi:hypothetical protein
MAKPWPWRNHPVTSVTTAVASELEKILTGATSPADCVSQVRSFVSFKLHLPASAPEPEKQHSRKNGSFPCITASSKPYT